MADRRRPGSAPDPCAVSDCDRASACKGYCRKHYKAFKKHGTPTPRGRGEVMDGMRVCPRCKLDLPVAQFGTTCCRACEARRVMAYYVPAPASRAACEVCGAEFLATKRRRFACSPECTRIRTNRENATHVHRRRAQQRATLVERFKLRDIYERDEWTCRLCGLPIDRSVTKPHPDSPSIDHVVPLARGGVHTPENVQAAHLGCNVRKGARLSEAA